MTENPDSFLCLSIICSFNKFPALSQLDEQTLFDIRWLSLALGGWMYYIEHVTKEMGFCSSFQLILCVLFFPPLRAARLITTLGPCNGTQTPQCCNSSLTLNLGICQLFLLSFLCKNYVEMFPSWAGCLWFSFAFLTQKDHNLSFLFLVS